jgi:hypothetical protein
MENECFPSLFEEGWMQPQFSHMALFAGGDGVVKTESGWLAWIWELLLIQEKKFSVHY